MKKRERWIVGNWKQNLLRLESEALARAIAMALPGPSRTGAASIHVGVAPTSLALDVVRPWARPDGPLHVFAQNVAGQERGAFTGDVGPAMLRDAGATGVIIGHSERRVGLGESDAMIAAKVRCALAARMQVILCVGDPLAARRAGDHRAHLIAQLSSALALVDPMQVDSHLLIAYEPVWAIEAGVDAAPEEASEMHLWIRGWLGERYDGGYDRSILHGGIVTASRAAALLAAGDIDGFLVGKASLDAGSFAAVVASAMSLQGDPAPAAERATA